MVFDGQRDQLFQLMLFDGLLVLSDVASARAHVNRLGDHVH